MLQGGGLRTAQLLGSGSWRAWRSRGWPASRCYDKEIYARDYIEFLTVEDRPVFEAAQAGGEREWTEKPFAQGVGIRIKQAELVYRALSAQGVPVKPVWSKKEEG